MPDSDEVPDYVNLCDLIVSFRNEQQQAAIVRVPEFETSPRRPWIKKSLTTDCAGL